MEEPRKTKIICTIGPASQTPEIVREMVLAGMDVARLNFSHGTHEEMRQKIKTIKQVREELKKPVALMLDTKGPEIRLGNFQGGKAQLEPGKTFVLTAEEVLGDESRATISYKNLVHDVQVGETLLIDDGKLELRITDVSGTEITTQVVVGGMVSNHKGVNAPGTVLHMPYVSEADRKDILFGIEMDMDCIAISFVRSKEDVQEIRKILKEHNSRMKIISKIENDQGIKNLEEIIACSDGLMVARGDMGVEIPFERVPYEQKHMIKLCNEQGVFTITATQMLESMIHSPHPTRAETADVANAIYDGTCGIMLSGESATGEYPVQAVRTMDKIAREVERSIDYSNYEFPEKPDMTTSVAYATCMAAKAVGAKLIIAVTASGYTAEEVSRFRPNCPIAGCTFDAHTYQLLAPEFGVVPVMMPEEHTTRGLFAHAVAACKEQGLIVPGDTAVLIAGVPVGKAHSTNTMHVVHV